MYYLLRLRYYQRGISIDIIHFVYNYYLCRYIYILRDKTLGILYPLPILEQLQQYITIDYKSMPKDKYIYNTILIFINYLSKQSISKLYYKTTLVEDIAQIYIRSVYRYYSPLQSIVSDRSPQFILQFWKEFCRILRTKTKLSIANHL